VLYVTEFWTAALTLKALDDNRSAVYGATSKMRLLWQKYRSDKIILEYGFSYIRKTASVLNPQCIPTRLELITL